MKSLLIRNVLLLLAALWLASAAQAQADYYVDITNRTGYVIHRIHVSPVDSDSWEADLLGSSVLPHGQTFRVHLRGYRSPMFDIRLVDQDGDTYTYRRVDVARRDIVALPTHLDPRRR